MNKNTEQITLFLSGVVAGGTLLFLYDPINGKRRRALVRDKAFSFKNHSLQYAGKHFRDLRNRGRGLVYEMNNLLKVEDNVDDEILIQRVRSAFGKKVIHTKSIDVLADRGVVTLSGPILSREVANLISCVRKVPGVTEVINDLDIHETSEGIPDLQGNGPVYLQN